MNDLAEDRVSGEVIELTKGCMDTLRVLEAHFCVLVSLVDTLWLAIEDDLFEFGGVDSVLIRRNGSFVGEFELKDTLLACDLTSVVSVLLQLL